MKTSWFSDTHTLTQTELTLLGENLQDLLIFYGTHRENVLQDFQ